MAALSAWFRRAGLGVLLALALSAAATLLGAQSAWADGAEVLHDNFDYEDCWAYSYGWGEFPAYEIRVEGEICYSSHGVSQTTITPSGNQIYFYKEEGDYSIWERGTISEDSWYWAWDAEEAANYEHTGSLHYKDGELHVQHWSEDVEATFADNVAGWSTACTFTYHYRFANGKITKNVVFGGCVVTP